MQTLDRQGYAWFHSQRNSIAAQIRRRDFSVRLEHKGLEHLKDTIDRASRFLAVASMIWYENHTNFVFIYNYETGFCESNAGVPTLIGKDMRSVKDANGLPFASIMMEAARSKGDGTLRFSFLKSLRSFPKACSIT